MTRIITEIDLAVKEIIDGNVVGLPTETVYGLGANALNENAVVKIYETKDRPKFNPIIIHIHDLSEIEKYAVDIQDEVYELAEKFSPGPITFVLKKRKLIPDIVTAGNDNIGLRIPSHQLFREVLKDAGLPVAAPSANRAGRISPTSAMDVMTELGGKINYILDGGKCEIGIESTVISFLEGDVKILRHGFITKEDIEKVVGKTSGIMNNEIVSPGLLKIHYAPVTPLYLVGNFQNVNTEGKKIGFLDFSKYKNYKDIAVNLFSDLRKLDEMNFDIIVAEQVEDKGLGVAINDRLIRASNNE